MNSRTSRPRSPTSAMTTLSKASARASIDSNVDLPTPEPAKMPRRCPRQSGEKMSIARTPVRKPCSTRLRVIDGGAVLEIERRTSPCNSGPRPSIGSARALIARPHHWSVGATRKAPLRMTVSWMPMGSPGSIGQTTTRSGSRPAPLRPDAYRSNSCARRNRPAAHAATGRSRYSGPARSSGHDRPERSNVRVWRSARPGRQGQPAMSMRRSSSGLRVPCRFLSRLSGCHRAS